MNKGKTLQEVKAEIENLEEEKEMKYINEKANKNHIFIKNLFKLNHFLFTLIFIYYYFYFR